MEGRMGGKGLKGEWRHLESQQRLRLLDGNIAARFPHDEIEARKGGMVRLAEQRQWYLSPTDAARLGKCQYMFKFSFTGAEPPLPSLSSTSSAVIEGSNKKAQRVLGLNAHGPSGYIHSRGGP